MVRTRAAGAVALLVLTSGGWAEPAHAAGQSTTTLVLSSPSSSYGQTVTATAQVVTDGTADGDVEFTIGGTILKANLNGAGSASIVLPRTAAVGEHAISATFKPRFPNQQAQSTSPTTTWVVGRARTQLQVRVTGRGAHVPTGVVVFATGDYGTRPTGALTVTVRHLKSGKVTRRVRTLDASGAATARVGVLRTGRYRLRVRYAGDGQHLAGRHSEKFTVRQR